MSVSDVFLRSLAVRPSPPYLGLLLIISPISHQYVRHVRRVSCIRVLNVADDSIII